MFIHAYTHLIKVHTFDIQTFNLKKKVLYLQNLDGEYQGHGAV